MGSCARGDFEIRPDVQTDIDRTDVCIFVHFRVPFPLLPRPM